VPHKRAALAFAVERDPLAAAAGAANTLVPAAGGWRAHNTDVQGFVRALDRDLDFRARGRRCLVLGAGGAARAAAVGLLAEGAQEILIANRNGERAEALTRELTDDAGISRLRAVGLEDGPELLRAGDLLVSATPLGLDPRGCWPWELRRFASGVAVYDMAYRRDGETSLVRAARAVGFRAASGLAMLLYQGALAFSLWTGLEAPVAAMERALNPS
jgi:shikimate dehydrogenase